MSLVSLYGANKPRDLLKLIEEALARLRLRLGHLLVPYDPKLIHGTIIGLEGIRSNRGRIVNTNLLDLFSRRRSRIDEEAIPEMDLDGLLKFLRSGPWPLKVQFGGYGPRETNPCDPGRSPFERSFSIQDSGLVVMMGWPISPDGEPFAAALANLRRQAEMFNVVHKYHVSSSHEDNDLFLVLGSLDIGRWSQASNEERGWLGGELSKATKEVRKFIAENRHLVRIGVEDLWIVEYFRTTLQKVGFCKPLPNVSAEELYAIYQ